MNWATRFNGAVNTVSGRGRNSRPPRASLSTLCGRSSKAERLILVCSSLMQSRANSAVTSTPSSPSASGNLDNA